MGRRNDAPRFHGMGKVEEQFEDDKNLVIDRDTAECLGRVFDVSADYFLNLDHAWSGVK